MEDEKASAMLKIFGQNLKKCMAEKGIDFDELSEKTGIRKQYLKKITEGNCPGIKTSYLFIIAEVLKVRPHELVIGC